MYPNPKPNPNPNPNLMQEAREILRRSVSRPSEERKKILRDLQARDVLRSG